MSSYGFGKDNQPAMGSLKLPTQTPREVTAEKPPMSQILQAGAELGFVPRDASTRRKTGPRRTEQQDKITVTGAKRVIDRLKAYCDKMGEPSYCTAIEHLLDMAEQDGK